MSAQLSIDAIMALPAANLDEFEHLFWPAYPPNWRGRLGKVAAKRAFVRARRRASMAVIMAGLAAYRFGDDPRFVPHASTWLNNDYWASERAQDPALDPWGLRAWYGRQSEQSPELFSVRGWDFEVMREVMLATGLPFDWRGDLGVLGSWLVAGFRPDSLAEVIAEDGAGSSSAPQSLRWFDRAVRRRALRWSAAKSEWVRG
jgi:hypothetical protein